MSVILWMVIDHVDDDDSVVQKRGALGSKQFGSFHDMTGVGILIEDKDGSSRRVTCVWARIISTRI